MAAPLINYHNLPSSFHFFAGEMPGWIVFKLAPAPSGASHSLDDVFHPVVSEIIFDRLCADCPFLLADRIQVGEADLSQHR